MAVAQAAEVARPRTTSERIAHAASRGPLHIALIAIAVVWCVPTIGLLLTSFRPKDDILSTGWWHIFGNLGSLTLTNYSEVIHAAVR
jgi:alpha-glucoside transport system permease protein